MHCSHRGSFCPQILCQCQEDHPKTHAIVVAVSTPDQNKTNNKTNNNVMSL